MVIVDVVDVVVDVVVVLVVVVIVVVDRATMIGIAIAIANSDSKPNPAKVAFKQLQFHPADNPSLVFLSLKRNDLV